MDLQKNFVSSRLSGKITVYEKLTRLGQGKFGEVYRARIKGTEELVALKRVVREEIEQGFPMSALTEIKILKKVHHENIVHLYEVSSMTESNHLIFFLVLEYCELDLSSLISKLSVKLELPVIKMIMKQIFQGLSFIHDFIIHRDIRPSNILLTRCGLVKLADFQSARFYSPIYTEEVCSNKFVSLWYRAPELLVGVRNYSPKNDMWSAGCVMAELWIRAPIIQGDSVYEQIALISVLCGTINSEVFPGAEKLYPLKAMKLPTMERLLRNTAKNYFKDLLAVALFDKLLTLDPKLRINSTRALDDAFFIADPQPSGLAELVSSVIDSTVISEGEHEISLESCGRCTK